MLFLLCFYFASSGKPKAQQVLSETLAKRDRNGSWTVQASLGGSSAPAQRWEIPLAQFRHIP